MDGDTFKHYYERFFCRQYDEDGNEVGITYEQMKKIYVTYSLLPRAINEIVLLSPIFENFNTTVKKKIKPLRQATKQMQWNVLYPEIIKTLETKGDFYSYWYYESSQVEVKGWNQINTPSEVYWENPIPRIKVLESKNMKDIILDSNNEPLAYVYEEDKVHQTLNDSDGTTTSKTYTVQTIFKKGYIRVNDTFTYPKKGYAIFPNKDFEEDIIRLIYVPSFKNQNDKFSSIPAMEYIDPALVMDNITSDLRYINRLAGFAVNWSVDLDIDWENSSFLPGGVVNSQTSARALENSKQGFIHQVEMKSELKSLQFERDIVNKDYYKKTSLIREELEESMGNSDSSRVLAQLRLLLSNKFEKYVDNIIAGFNPYFTSVLKSTKSYTDKDKNLSFKSPDIYINTSVFDSLAITNMKLAMGMTTMEEEWDKDDMTEVDKANRKKYINEEKMMGADDISISDGATSTATNGQASENELSNEFKQDSNIK